MAYNRITALGLALAVVAAGMSLLLFAFESVTVSHNPYFGIFLYMVLPPFVLLGLLLIPLGMFRRWRAMQRGERTEPVKWPHIDLNVSSHRNAFTFFMVGTIVFLALTSFGAYHAYEYSESVDFCGKTCHTVMHPEFVPYESSPHARVACVECHVGPGAGWYARSKLSGAYQVYAVLFDKFPRPIPTPIENLRPAQETCMECHWPEKFFGGQQRRFNHSRYDDENSSWPINMLINTGGGDPATGQTVGIHWHMNANIRIEYVARDEKRLDIPWVKVTELGTGKVTIYEDEDDPMDPEELAAEEPRVMDCIDCHNRPSHKLRSPDHAMDLALLGGRIDRSLPGIKRVAVASLAESYATREEARSGIAEAITTHFVEDHPDVYEGRRPAVEEAVRAVQSIHERNFFPDMGVQWDVYPDHIGHMEFPGCMRCHNGRHKSADGREIVRECSSCHTILSQGTGERYEVTANLEAGLRFVHPEDIGEAWTEMGCYECHEGIQP